MKFHAPPAYEKPFDAVVVNGEVVIMGNRTSEALTPEAALESADRIRKAAEEALQRRVSGDADDEPW